LRFVFASIAAVALLAAGAASAQDAAAGEKTFARLCKSCHIPTSNKSTPMAPNINGVAGRDIASLADFKYSEGLKGKPGVWTDANLDTYLTAPAQFAAGTKMIVKVAAPADRANIIAYLKTLK
jgi:cytochrome c